MSTDAIMDPDDAVLLGVMMLAQSHNLTDSTQPVGREWLRLKHYYAPSSVEVSAKEAEHWLTMFLRFVRQSELPVSRRTPVLHAISDAIRAVRTGKAPVCRNDLLRWTQIAGWASATGMLRETKQAAARLTEADSHGPSAHHPHHQGSDVDFSSRLIEATQELMRARSNNLALGDVRMVYRQWLDQASEATGAPHVSMEFDSSASSFGGGFYKPFSMEIVLSVVDDEVLLHEFRHHLQYSGAVMVSADLEEDARWWARGLLDVVSQ